MLLRLLSVGIINTQKYAPLQDPPAPSLSFPCIEKPEHTKQQIEVTLGSQATESCQTAMCTKVPGNPVVDIGSSETSLYQLQDNKSLIGNSSTNGVLQKYRTHLSRSTNPTWYT
jgi:hypothetical protein